MIILVINSGSSSLKFQCFDMEKETVLAKGLVERIGMEDAIIQYESLLHQEKVKHVTEILEHKEGLKQVINLLTDQKIGVVESISDIHAVGHRVTHGGEEFSDSVLVDEQVIAAIDKNMELAPLHNPANLKGILAFQELSPDIPNVCVFDTAFHQTMPEKSYMYAIPKAIYNNYKVRKYGFHGTSHKYVSSRLAETTGVPLTSQKVISCHIGNGASITAIKDGISIDTSMGMTPLEGLIMGTRSGDIDPAIIQFVMMKDELTIDEVNSMLNKFSGLYGISGVSHDVREIIDRMEKGDKNCKLAIDMYVYRMVKYIGSYAAAMNGVDTIIFTGGVLENSKPIRKLLCENLTYLGLALDEELNAASEPKERKISSNHSGVNVYIIPTNEELMIARDTLRVIG
ncbi:acetate/propionate family kinase [Paucisalibacillus globulus]|uniref:acetate/propionate family kinase n=1 Tax=Paucisalibacillus globulus TaxID=351095 RepID=UPI00042500C7|nr:acetate kinase [Paucisalibacillus globulus]